MRVVGDGMNQAGVGDWSPGTSPQMTYAGKWGLDFNSSIERQIRTLNSLPVTTGVLLIMKITAVAARQQVLQERLNGKEETISKHLLQLVLIPLL
jgi:hypothetical protein